MDYIEIEQSEADCQFYWHRKAPNGEIISSGEGHTRERDAIRAARRANPDLAPAADPDETMMPPETLRERLQADGRLWELALAEGQVKALREAAREFAEGAWQDQFLEDEVEDDVSAVQSVDRWLRKRADEIEGEDPSWV